MTDLTTETIPPEAIVEDLWDLAALMVSVPSPVGDEMRLAECLADHGRRRWPMLTWWVDPVPEPAGPDGAPTSRANLIVSSSATSYEELGLVLLAHLDTSFASFEEVASLTGARGLSGPMAGELRIDGAMATGPGLAVAKGPGAAALAAAIEAARLGVLGADTAVVLTCGGTHRADPDDPHARYGVGLDHARRHGLAPRAVINVKAGAPGVLYEEPASTAFRVTVTAHGGPTLMREHSGPGAVVAGAAVIEVIEEWRTSLLEDAVEGQCARELGLGAIRAGLAHKADLLPGIATLDGYLVTTPDDDSEALLGDLSSYLARHPRVVGLDAEVQLAIVATLPAGRTAWNHPVVQVATRAWQRHFGTPSKVHGWSGSTDGALVRFWGIPAVRLGPRAFSAGPGIEALDRNELEHFARIHVEIIAALASPDDATPVSRSVDS